MGTEAPKADDLRDGEFLALFEEAKLDDFKHRSHVRMAWLILRADGRDQGTQRILEDLRRYTVAYNAEAMFHHTLTVFWIHLVERALRRIPEVLDFEEFLARNPPLLRSGLAFDYYSRERLMSDEARCGWVPPDLKPLP